MLVYSIDSTKSFEIVRIIYDKAAISKYSVFLLIEPENPKGKIKVQISRGRRRIKRSKVEIRLGKKENYFAVNILGYLSNWAWKIIHISSRCM